MWVANPSQVLSHKVVISYPSAVLSVEQLAVVEVLWALGDVDQDSALLE